MEETKGANTRGLLSLFRSGNFSLLWSSTLASQLGDHLNLMALTALIFSLSAGAIKGLEFSKILLLASAPVLIFGPISGVYADRLSRKKMMIVSDVVRALLVAAIPFFARSMIPVYVIVFIVFTVNRFYLSARSAAIPQIVAERPAPGGELPAERGDDGDHHAGPLGRWPAGRAVRLHGRIPGRLGHVRRVGRARGLPHSEERVRDEEGAHRRARHAATGARQDGQGGHQGAFGFRTGRRRGEARPGDSRSHRGRGRGHRIRLPPSGGRPQGRRAADAGQQAGRLLDGLFLRRDARRRVRAHRVPGPRQKRVRPWRGRRRHAVLRRRHRHAGGVDRRRASSSTGSPEGE